MGLILSFAYIAKIATPLERVNMLGTRNYTAPEYTNDQPGSQRSDLFSLGVIMYEMLTGQLPYDEMPSSWADKDPLKGRHYQPDTAYNSSVQD